MLLYHLSVGPKKIVLLFPEMRVTKKIFTRAAGKKLVFVNLIVLFNKVYT